LAAVGPHDARGRLLARALVYEYATISYNVGEGVLSLAAGVLAGSIALLGFGFDSSIEIAAAVVVTRHLRAEVRARHLDHSGSERRALRAVAVTFVVLGAYIVLSSVRSIAVGERPQESLLGIGIAVASLVTMPSLAAAKLRLARKLGSEALEADAKETLVCAYLSAMLLLGLGLNAAFGWWWADPAGALLMAPFVFLQAKESLEESREIDEAP
jgi:divalent metal cation (Fe/Co/Zn/Cd) transporter